MYASAKKFGSGGDSAAMTPSIPESQLEQFIHDSGWAPVDEKIDPSSTEGSKSDGNNVLVFSRSNRAYVMDNDKEIFYLGMMQNLIFSISSHQDKLYHAGRNMKITELMDGDEIAHRTSEVSCICSYQGIMYDASFDCCVRRTSTHSVEMKSETGIDDMCTHQGDLYIISGGKLLKKSGHHPFITPPSEQHFEGLDDVTSLCSHEGSLFVASGDMIFDQSYPIVLERFKNDRVWSLCSHEGHLYASGSMQGIFNISTGEINAKGMQHLDTMCSHPRQYFVEWGVLPP